MATFERYFVEDKSTHTEIKNSYYRLMDNEEVLNRILREFGLDENSSHIINGHVPVELKKGGNSYQVRREAAHHRRRFLQGLSGENRDCRLYAGGEFPRYDFGCP